jgi:hypothetical protein
MCEASYTCGKCTRPGFRRVYDFGKLPYQGLLGSHWPFRRRRGSTRRTGGWFACNAAQHELNTRPDGWLLTTDNTAICWDTSQLQSREGELEVARGSHSRRQLGGVCTRGVIFDNPLQENRRHPCFACLCLSDLRSAHVTCSLGF